MKSIKLEQINAVLQAIYQTNISAANFDAIKKLFTDLPDAVENILPLEKTTTQKNK